MFFGYFLAIFAFIFVLATYFIVREGPNAAGYNFLENSIHGAIHHSFRAEFQGLSDKTMLKLIIFLGLIPPPLALTALEMPHFYSMTSLLSISGLWTTICYSIVKNWSCFRIHHSKWFARPTRRWWRRQPSWGPLLCNQPLLRKGAQI